MMKKILYWIILILLILLLVACGPDNINLSEKIVAPENDILPIAGKWVIEDYKLGSTSTMGEGTAKTYIGKEVLFHKKLVTMGDEICWEPSFKTKIVNPTDYLIYQYKTTPEYLNIDEDEVQIVSIESGDQFFSEYIKLSKERVIVNIEGTFFTIKKVSEHIEPEIIEEYYKDENIKPEALNVKKDEDLGSGILIGLKSLNFKKSEDSLENWQYRTIFIRRDDKELASIYEMDGIFLPRKKGFSKIEVNRLKSEGKANDKITIYNRNQVSDSEVKIESNEYISNKPIDEKTLKNILYIGNDYISIEKVHHLNKGERTLELHLIDYLDKDKALKISDISGEIGKEAFLEGANKAIKTEHINQKDSSIDLKPKEESFGLFRRSGHWIFRGRLDIVEDNKYSYKDFNIKAIPPKELVHYDELPIPWSKIKTRIPEAVDAFVSPNEDMLIVLTHNTMLIYLVDDGNISYTPEAKIKLNSAERVIMNEWATGKYSLMWEKEFLENEVHSLK